MASEKVSTSKRLDGVALGPSRQPPEVPVEATEIPPVIRARKVGARGRAKQLHPQQVAGVMAWIARNDPYPEFTMLMFLFSFGAGLRVSEIARLDWSHVTDAEGKLANAIEFLGSKGGKPRSVPMDARIGRCLVAFHRRYPNAERFAINPKTGEARTTNALTVWFHRKYGEMGLIGCSSHSGRRSLLTHLARNCGRFKKSVRDVQIIAGHARLDTTQAYIQPSDDLHELINSASVLPQEYKVPSSQGRRPHFVDLAASRRLSDTDPFSFVLSGLGDVR